MTDKKTIDGIDYTRIDWADVKAGDVLMHENGDRLTVKRVKKSGTEKGYIPIRWIETVTAFQTGEGWKPDGFSPYRRKPELPTAPGAYHDKDGQVWVRDDDWDYSWRHRGFLYSDQNAAKYAPFTPLVPIPTKEAVHAAVYNALRGCAVDGKYPLRTINAVMALLTGKEADNE